MRKFCWHDWPEWGAPVDTSTGFEKRQFRFCKKCNALDHRTENFNASITAAKIIESTKE